MGLPLHYGLVQLASGIAGSFVYRLVRDRNDLENSDGRGDGHLCRFLQCLRRRAQHRQRLDGYDEHL
ncbi:hypothetical protein D3C73_1543090 [compost metagenome]